MKATQMSIDRWIDKEDVVHVYSGILSARSNATWTSRRPNQSIIKEISPEYSLEGLMLKLKFQSFGHLIQRTDSLEKTLMLGKIQGRKKRGATEDEMVGWYHWLDGHLGCFHVLAIANSAVINIVVHASFQIRVFSGHMPKSVVAGSYGNSICTF